MDARRMRRRTDSSPSVQAVSLVRRYRVTAQDKGVSDALPPVHWRRLAAGLIDQVVIGVPSLLVGLPFYLAPTMGPQLFPPEIRAMPYVLVAYLGIGAWYCTRMYASSGATLGKKLLQLQLLNEDDTMPTWDAALMRYAVWIVSVALFGYGFFRILAHPRRQALHDTLIGTKVVLRSDR